MFTTNIDACLLV